MSRTFSIEGDEELDCNFNLDYFLQEYEGNEEFHEDLEDGEDD